MVEQKIRVGISQGDINGIGLEVIMKTFENPVLLELCTPVLFGSQKTLSYHRKNLGLAEFNYKVVADAAQASERRFNIVSIYEEEALIEMGKPTKTAGLYALKSLQAACLALENKKVDVLVTAPIDKHTIRSEEFPFAGHTEFLAQRFKCEDPLMFFISDKLNIGMLSGHVPVHQISTLVTPERILKKLKAIHKSMAQDFAVPKPTIAILGLNPHAGDKGTIGSEEMEIILPTMEKARSEGMLLFGPYPADGFFASAGYEKVDAVLAMYHDQGLIPFKSIAGHEGVNFTAGLSVVRTSPDHGTGYEIAGKNVASEVSFRRAVYLACDVFRTRKRYLESAANPLKTSQFRTEERRP